MTDDTYDPVAHMVTISCPYGCGTKLRADPDAEGHAVCLNVSPVSQDGWDLDECRGYGISYANSDEVVHASLDLWTEARKQHAALLEEQKGLIERTRRAGREVERLKARFDRIIDFEADQHG
tara:strand:- start:1559 stop:1924 length:366 start_codon:yes stop_codon:yes gene_type:complete